MLGHTCRASPWCSVVWRRMGMVYAIPWRCMDHIYIIEVCGCIVLSVQGVPFTMETYGQHQLRCVDTHAV